MTSRKVSPRVELALGLFRAVLAKPSLDDSARLVGILSGLNERERDDYYAGVSAIVKERG